MKQKIILFFLFGASMLSGCRESSMIEPEEKKEAFLSYQVVYQKEETGKVEYPDAGARLFLYYDLEGSDFTGLVWKGDGVLMRGDTAAIYPDAGQTADKEGKAEFYVSEENFNRPFCIFVESHYYKDRQLPTVSYYPGWQTGRSTKLIFTVPWQ